MSWLGDSFQSLTGQISNFTREVLTEGVEERSDHVAELTVSKSQVQELANQCQVLRQEVVRLKNLNSELEDKAQSSEIQTRSLSTDYRGLLQNKEDELKLLKQKLCNVSSDGAAPYGGSANQDCGFDFGDQSAVLELDDVIDIANENSTNLQLHHQRNQQTSASRTVTGQQIENGNYELQEQVKQLQEQLHTKLDQHQSELSALQDFHQQKYSEIKEQYDLEIARLHSKITLLDDHSDENEMHRAYMENKAKIGDLNAKIANFEEINDEKNKTIQLVNRQLDQTQAEKSILESELEFLKNQLKDIPKEKEIEDDMPDKASQFYKESLQKLQEELNETKKSRDQLESVVESMELQYETSNVKIQELSLNKEAEQELVFQMTAENQLLQKNIEELDGQHREALNQVISSKNELNQSNIKLKEDLKDLQDKLEDEINVQLQTVDSLKAKVFEILESNPDLKLLVGKEMSEESYSSAILSAMEKLNNENLDLRCNLENHVGSARTEIQEKVAECERLKNALVEERNSKEELMVKSEEQYGSLKEELKVLASQCDALSLDLKCKEKVIEDLLEQNEDLVEQNKVLKPIEEHFLEEKSAFEAEICTLKERLGISVVAQDSLTSSRGKSHASEGSSGGSEFEIIVKDDGSDQSSTGKEFVQLEEKEAVLEGEVDALLHVKEAEIKILQDKILAMSQQLIDCQCNSSFEDNSLHFDEENKQLKCEKEQMLDVMNEKIRECCALKEENLRLVDVIAVEKQTVEKQDGDERNECESLRQEKEVLAKEVDAYKNDREQILTALNQKHQESLHFHSELKRAQALLSEESQKHENFQLTSGNLAEEFEEKQKMLSSSQNEVVLLKQRLENLENAEGKDTLSLDSSLKIDELEATVLDKENMAAELQVTVNNLQEELEEKQRELVNGCQLFEDFKTKYSTLKDVNGQLSAKLHEKDAEIQNLSTRISTLDTVLEKEMSSNHDENTKINRLLAENQSISSRALQNVAQYEQEKSELQQEIMNVCEREKKLVKELERLRLHLLMVEESYTKEAICSEEREKELRNRLTAAEERIIASASTYNSVNQQANQHMDSLQEQLKVMTQQRDELKLKMTDSESQTQQYCLSLNNLQLVLEQFQQEKNRDIEAIKRKFQQSVEAEKDRNKNMVKEIENKEMKIKEAMEALSAASRLSEQLDRKEELINSLKNEATRKEQKLQNLMKEMQNFTSNAGGKVDKQVMKSLVLGYFNTPDDKKPEVMRLLAGVLDFNQQEVEKVKVVRESLMKKGSWLAWLGRPEGSNQSGSENSSKDSFSEAFVQFLQKESQPQVQVRLPAEEMAKELTMKTKNPNKDQSSLKLLRMNPFTASTKQSSPTQKVTPSQLLIKPITASLPTFAPLPIQDSSSNILKDVLKEK